MRYKKALWTLPLLLLLALSLTVQAGAYGEDEVVGEVSMLLRATQSDETKNATNQGCTLGSAAADAARYAAGSDFAILNGGDLASNLQPGEVTWSALQSAFSADRELAVVTVTAEELFDLLESGVSHAVLDEHLRIDREASSFDGFPQISGFTFTYDMSAPVGERIYSVVLADGEELTRDSGGTFTLCATAYMLSGGFDYPTPTGEITPLGQTVVEAFADYISSGLLDASAYSRETRISVIGCTDYNLLSSSPVAAVILLAVMMFVTAGYNIRKKLQFRRDF